MAWPSRERLFPEGGVKGGKRHVTADENPAPDQQADDLHDDAELIGIG